MYPQTMVEPPKEPFEHKSEAPKMGSHTPIDRNHPGKSCMVIVLVIAFLLIIWGVWKILPYLPVGKQDVKLKSAIYQRSPHVYRCDQATYNPQRAPLAPEWIQLEIDIKSSMAVFQSSTGEVVKVAVGEPQWMIGCENQYRVETHTLPTDLTLGSIKFEHPILIVACDMWAMSEKIRPARLVIKEGPLPTDDPFYLGMECDPSAEKCMSFAENLAELAVTIVDNATLEALPDAHITISSGLGIQEFYGSFRVAVYTAMQLDYQVEMPGYKVKVGEISNSYENKLDIMYYTNIDHTRGSGETLDLTGNGAEVDYQIVLSKK